VLEIALRLERSFDEPFLVRGSVIEGSASVGIALYPEDASTRDALLRVSDAAMYKAKHSRSGKKKEQAGVPELGVFSESRK
jgi:GGDEF domain-containing protein